jgi:hypothetical protein
MGVGAPRETCNIFYWDRLFIAVCGALDKSRYSIGPLISWEMKNELVI